MQAPIRNEIFGWAEPGEWANVCWNMGHCQGVSSLGRVEKCGQRNRESEWSGYGLKVPGEKVGGERRQETV